VAFLSSIVNHTTHTHTHTHTFQFICNGAQVSDFIRWPFFDTQRKFSAAALVTSVAAAVSAFGAWRYFSRRRARQVPASHTKKERLLDIESTMLMDYLPGTSTITFYQGDASTVAKFLSERLARVVELNPWCLGSVRYCTISASLA
jgi:hypothetical protein